MKLLPLLALGGAIYLFTKDKKYPSSSSKSESVTSKIGSKEIGYEIINCTKLIIHNKDKAFEYAFNIGALEAIKGQKLDPSKLTPEVLLLGNCFEKYESEYFNTEQEKLAAKDKAIAQFKKLFNTKDKAKFYFELEQWLYTGLVKVGLVDPEFALQQLNKTKDNFAKITGYDVSDLVPALKM